MFFILDRKAQETIKIALICIILLAAVLIWLARVLLRKRHMRTLSLEQQDEMLVLLTERCPQANQRDYGTYL